LEKSYERQLIGEVQKRIPVVKSGLIDYRSCQDDIEQTFSQIDSVQAVIVGFFVRWGSYKGSVSLPDTIAQMLFQFFITHKETK